MRRNYRRGKERRGWSSHKRGHQPHRPRRSDHNNRAQSLEQEEPQTPVNAGPSSNEDPSSSSSTQSSVAPELPGFYYDPEKNRYFRLLPGHNNHNPLTKDSIQHKAMECKRLRLLEEEEKQHQKTARAGLNSSVLLQKRQLGSLTPTSYCRLVHELKVNCMQRRKIKIHSPDSSVAGTSNFKIIVADVACERIFTVNDVEHGGCKYGIINLSGLGKESLTVEMYDNLYFTNRKVNSVCWASLTHPDSHVFKLCLMGIAETPGCASLLPASLFSSTNPGDRPGMLCSFKISTAWSCAWCLNPQADNCFSTGLTRRVLVTNVVTGHRQTFGTSSDVLAQQFATQTPVLYNGCRSGEIFSIDVRQRNRKGQSWKAIRLFHGSAVTSIHLMEAEHYLMAADMAGKDFPAEAERFRNKMYTTRYLLLWNAAGSFCIGPAQMFRANGQSKNRALSDTVRESKIKLWDLRTAKCVKQYKGHHNEYALLPLHVNEEEGLLIAVGQDCYTRIWSLQDTHLLRTIPSPHPSSKDAIPSVVFSSRLGGSRGVPGLLMAVKQDLYHFSYN